MNVPKPKSLQLRTSTKQFSSKIWSIMYIGAQGIALGSIKLNRWVRNFEPWGICLTFIGLVAAFIGLMIEIEDRQSERIFRAWDIILSVKANTSESSPGPNNEIPSSGGSSVRQALQYLNRDFAGKGCFSWVAFLSDYLTGNHVRTCIFPKKGRESLGYISIPRANLTGIILPKAKLWGADLRGAYLVEADLNGARLTEANLKRAKLIGAKLGGAGLYKADLTDADLSGADLRGAKGLSQEQLNSARADSINPPNLDGLRDPQTGMPLMCCSNRPIRSVRDELAGESR